MRSGYAGRCACCGRSFAAGAEIVSRPGGGWVLAACAAPARSSSSSSGPAAGPAEVLEVLASARAVAARQTALERARAGGR